MVMKWEYMGQDQQIHGPYTSKEMYEWMQQGFFTGDNAVYMREYQGVGVGSTPKNSAGNLVGTSKEVENDFESDEEVENGEAESKGPNSSQFPSAASIYSSWTLSDDIDWSVMQDIAAPETEKGKALLQNRADDDDRDDDGRLYKRKRNEMKDEDSGEDD